MKTRLLENIQLFLESKNGLKKSWIRTAIVVLLALVIVSIVIGLGVQYGPGGVNFNSILPLSNNLAVNKSFLAISQYISYTTFAVAVFPFICLFASWIIGINQTSRSKYFHLFLWIFAFLALVLAIVALIIFIRAAVFNLDTYFA